jgi:hypothetical protein
MTSSIETSDESAVNGTVPAIPQFFDLLHLWSLCSGKSKARQFAFYPCSVERIINYRVKFSE